MIVDKGKHYLYRHIRLDTEEVFYIGIGTKLVRNFRKFNAEYERAFSKKKRIEYWNRIVNKAGYRIEILVESNDYEFIKGKEKEFIKLYGRHDLKLGQLVNCTDGGDGVLGQIVSKETRDKIANSHKKGNYKRERNKQSIKIYQYAMSGEFIKEWLCAAYPAEFYKVTVSNILIASKKNKSAVGYQWSQKKVDNIGKRVIKINESKSVPIIVRDLINNKYLEYKSIQEAAKSLNMTELMIGRYTRGFSNQPDGYIFMYKNENKRKSFISKRRKYKLFVVKNGKYYNSVKEAAKDLNMNESSMYAAIKRKSKKYIKTWED